MKPNQIDIIPKLQEWERVSIDYRKEFDAFCAVFGQAVDSPFIEMLAHLYLAYTGTIAREVGDDSEWLLWHFYENDMGKKRLQVISRSGDKKIDVSSIDDLAEVICW